MIEIFDSIFRTNEVVFTIVTTVLMLLNVVIAEYAKSREIGGWTALLVCVFLTPIIGFMLVSLSKRLEDIKFQKEMTGFMNDVRRYMNKESLEERTNTNKVEKDNQNSGNNEKKREIPVVQPKDRTQLNEGVKV